MFKALPVALSNSSFYKLHTRQIVTTQNGIQTIRGYLLGRKSLHKIKTPPKHVLRHTYLIRAKLFAKMGYTPLPKQRETIVAYKATGRKFYLCSTYRILQLCKRSYK